MDKKITKPEMATSELGILLYCLYGIFFGVIIISAIIRRIITIFIHPRKRLFKKKRKRYLYKILITGSSWLTLRSNTEIRLSLQGSKGTTPFYVLPNKYYLSTSVAEESMLQFNLITKERISDLRYLTLWVHEKTLCNWHADVIIVEDVQQDKVYYFEIYCTLEVTPKPKLYIVPCRSEFYSTFISRCVTQIISLHNWFAAILRCEETFDVSNNVHFTMIFLVFLHSLFVGVVTQVHFENQSSIIGLAIETFYFFYLLIFTMIPDIITHISKTRNWGRRIWNYEVLEHQRPRLYSKDSSSSWEYPIEKRNVRATAIQKSSDDSKREVDLEAGDVSSVDSAELLTLIEQRYSAIKLFVAKSEEEESEDEKSDRASWMGFFDQESPFFVIPKLDKYTQYTTLFHPFNPRQLVRNRVSLWIHFLRKWHKVQLKSINTYRLLYALWWEWEKLDLDLLVLQDAMNKVQALVVDFQNTGQKIRDHSIWMKSNPLWTVGIELPQDEKLLEPYNELITLLEHTVIHVMANFLDHFNDIQRQRRLSHDIEWFIEDWFRELLKAFLHEGYLTKKTVVSDVTERHYWLPPEIKKSEESEVNKAGGHLIHVVPSLHLGGERHRSADTAVARTWASWLPTFIISIGDHILEAIQEHTMDLPLIDAITYIQMQKDGCTWEEACVRIMGIATDVVLQDVIDNMCVFLPKGVKRVILQRTRATLKECLNESASPWATYSDHDQRDRQRHYTLVSVLRGCVARCKTTPIGPLSDETAIDDPQLHANKVHLLFLLSGDLPLADLPTPQLLPKLNQIAKAIFPKIHKLKHSIAAIRHQFDLLLESLTDENVRQRDVAVVLNTLLSLCRLETAISQVELCRDALDLDIPYVAMVGNYKRINLKQFFRLLATQYGHTRLGRRYSRRPSRRSISRVQQSKSIQLQQNNKDIDVDVIVMLRHPWFSPLHYLWGIVMRGWFCAEMAILTWIIIQLGEQLHKTSFFAACTLMVVGVLMDFAFVQPIKCFLFVLLHRSWQRSGVRYIYQDDAFKF